MECAAIRLGKCRWVGDDRQGVAFRPSWRHVAAATRRGPYAETAADTEFQVDHWELVPAMLAADERFEWSTNVPHAHYRRDSHYLCDSHRGAAMRALQRPVSPTTELLNDVADCD